MSRSSESSLEELTSVDAENVTKNSRGVPHYPLVLLLQLDVLRLYELIVNSPSCRLQYGRLPYLALAFLGRQPSHDYTRGLPMSIFRVHTRTEGHACVPSALSLSEPRSLKLRLKG